MTIPPTMLYIPKSVSPKVCRIILEVKRDIDIEKSILKYKNAVFCAIFLLAFILFFYNFFSIQSFHNLVFNL